jgi:hypothetical protein
MRFFEDGDASGSEFSLDEQGPLEEVRQEILAESEEEVRAMMEEELATRAAGRPQDL